MSPVSPPEPSRQLAHFGRADVAHYEWQTGDSYFADSERRLIEMCRLPTDGRVLEIGCGEGGNLNHLGAHDGWVGIDFARQKLGHAASALPGVRFVCADARRLPLASSSFDAVLIRDVLHHVPDRVGVLREAMRVLRWGGALGLIEPNRGNPMILAQAIFVGAERAVLSSDEPRLRRDLANAGFCDVSLERAQPMPLARLMHPRLGLDSLARRPGLGRLLGLADRALERVVPQAAWMYLVARARKPA
jgi:SAM-dependent methyltransferase